MEEEFTTYDEQLDHWTEIVRAVFAAENAIRPENMAILTDETMSRDQRVSLYCQNVAKEVLSATYKEEGNKTND